MELIRPSRLVLELGKSLRTLKIGVGTTSWFAVALGFSLTVLTLVQFLGVGDSSEYQKYLGSDHRSHSFATVLFWYRGTEIYSKPVKLIVDLRSGQIPERKGKRPFVINWEDFPRFYPPGFLLYFLPEALLLEKTSLATPLICKLSIIKILIASHILFWMIAQFLLSLPRSPPRAPPSPLITFLALPSIYAGIMIQGWYGIYDSLAIILSIIAVSSAAAPGKEARALLFFGLALFTHYRATWIAPVAVEAGLRLLNRGLCTRFERGEKLQAAVGTLLAGISTYTLFLSSDWLRRLPATNTFHWEMIRNQGSGWSYGVPLVLVLLLLIRHRFWLAASCIAFHTLLLLNTKQVMSWHLLSGLPWLYLAKHEAKPWRAANLVWVLLVLIWVQGRLVFGNDLVSGSAPSLLFPDFLRAALRF